MSLQLKHSQLKHSQNWNNFTTAPNSRYKTQRARAQNAHKGMASGKGVHSPPIFSSLS